MIERLVLLAASGDLTSRLLMPAVAQLAEAELLPQGFTIVGSANTEWSTEEFRPAHRRRAGTTLDRGAGHTRRCREDADVPAR
jgi:glucose-6-phosphate 1-dehydrogenase